MMGGTRGKLVTLAIVLGVASAPAPGPGEAGAQETPRLPPATAAELEELVGATLDSVPMPGMAVGVVSGGELVWARGFGVADLASRAPITPETLFQIGSISKSFTATLAAMLEARGALGMDDPAASRVPSARFPDDAITLRHLATHTSGLPGDAPNLRREHGDYPVLAFTHFELYRGLAESTLQFAPGEAWGYSNFGYGVLGHALEIATGTPYEVLVERELLDPLAMASTTVTIWPELEPRLATPYLLDDGRLTEYTPWDEEALAPAGGLASTLEDLGRYVAFQLRAGRAASDPSEGDAVPRPGVPAGGPLDEVAVPVGRLQRPHVPTGGGSSYGMGWFVEELPGVGRVVSVGGDVDGYVGELVLAPEHDLGTIILVNAGDAGPLPDLGRWLLSSLVAAREPGAPAAPGGPGEPGEPGATREEGRAPSAAAAEARYRLGMVQQGVRRWSDAVEVLSGVADHAGVRARALYQLGRTGALSGRHLDVAERALREYLTTEPVAGLSRAAARWRLGAVLEHAGRCEEAAEQYRAALEEDPSHGAARQAMEALRCDGRDGAAAGPHDAIAEAGRAFSRAYEAGDARALADFYTPDAVLAPPGGAVVRGADAILRFRGALDGDRVARHRGGGRRAWA